MTALIFKLLKVAVFVDKSWGEKKVLTKSENIFLAKAPQTFLGAQEMEQGVKF